MLRGGVFGRGGNTWFLDRALRSTFQYLGWTDEWNGWWKMGGMYKKSASMQPAALYTLPPYKHPCLLASFLTSYFHSLLTLSTK